MKKLHKFLAKSDLSIAGGSQPFMWECFGENRLISDLIFTEQEPVDAVISATYSCENVSRVYEISVLFNDVNFVYIDNRYIEQYLDEARSRGIDPYSSSDVYEIGDHISTFYVTYKEILSKILQRGYIENYFERFPLVHDDQAQSDQLPFPNIDEVDSGETYLSNKLKSYTVMLSLDFAYDVNAESEKHAINLAKQKLVDQVDINPMNFLVSCERAILNNGEV